MRVESAVLNTQYRLDQMERKIAQRGVGDPKRSHSPERLAVGSFEQERRLVGSAYRSVEGQVLQRPWHGGGDDERSGDARYSE